MSRILRLAGAGVAGVLCAFVLVAVVESIGHAVYPPPPDLDWSDRARLEAFVDGLPAGAFAFVLAGWWLGTLVGGVVATAIARTRPMLFAGIVGGFVLAATVVNFVLIPHPAWFTVLGVAGIVAMAWAAGRIGRRWAGDAAHDRPVDPTPPGQ